MTHGLTAKRVVEALLFVAVLSSAIAAVYAKHESRKLFTELQALKSERDQLEVHWGKLQIEQSTWSGHARVEQLAREKMQMRDPLSNEIWLFGE